MKQILRSVVKKPRGKNFWNFQFTVIIPYNVGSVLWRLLSTLEVVQYMGDNISTVGDSFSTVEVAQYSGGIASVLWGIDSVLWRLFSTVEVVQYMGDNISTVGDSFSTVEVAQYGGGIASVLWGLIQYCGGCSVQWGDNITTCGEITSVPWGITSVPWGITSVLWRVFSTVDGCLQYCGGNNSSTCGG